MHACGVNNHNVRPNQLLVGLDSILGVSEQIYGYFSEDK